jgi:hypothetical protein
VIRLIPEGAPSLEELCLRVWNRCEMTWDEEEGRSLSLVRRRSQEGHRFRGGVVLTLADVGVDIEEEEVGMAGDKWRRISGKGGNRCSSSPFALFLEQCAPGQDDPSVQSDGGGFPESWPRKPDQK